MARNNQILIGKQYAEELQCAICRAQKSVKMIVFCWSVFEEKKCEALFNIGAAIDYARRGGVAIQCLTGSEGLALVLRRRGIETKVLTTHKTIHAKFILIDDVVFFCGSHNLTKSGLELNLEVSVLQEFGDADNEASNLFQRLWEAR